MPHSHRRYELQDDDRTSAASVRRLVIWGRGNVKLGATIVSLLAGVILAVYYGWTAGDAEVDSGVSAMQIEYHCSRCGHRFSLSVSKSAQVRRDRGDIVCPRCDAPGAIKRDVSVVVSGDDVPDTSRSNENSETGEEVPQNASPTATRTGG